MTTNQLYLPLLLFLIVISVGLLTTWPTSPINSPLPSYQPTGINTPHPFFTKQTTHSSIIPSPVISPSPTPISELHEPVANFKARVTKKPFGIYITPDSSPIQPERFTGYHTGADAEYDDVIKPVPVYAIANGTVHSARRASGYGGIVVIKHIISNQDVLVIYGHLDPEKLTPTNTIVTAGQQIGHLGKGGTDDTDGERRHLHLGILYGTKLDTRGYVNNPDQLSKWLDPLTLY